MTSVRFSPLCLTAAVSLAGCVPHSQRVMEFRSTSYLAQISVRRGCPIVGLSTEGLRISMGRPTHRDSAPGGVTWRYHLGGHQLDVLVFLAGDTIQSWSLAGERTDVALDWAHLRGCPQPGMTVAQVRATIGAPGWWIPDPPLAQLAGRRYLAFGGGREGQVQVFVFVGDSLASAQYCPEGLVRSCPN